MKLAGLSLLLLALAVPCAQADSADGDVVEVANRVADWQLANLESLDGIRTFHERTAQQRGWVRAAFYIGLERWQGVTGDATYLQALYAMAEANEWRLDDRFWHADDQALQIIGSRKIDLVVSDVKMPKMDGMTLLSEIIRTQPGLPVIFLTAYANVPDAVNAVKAGAVDYVEKPFDGALIGKLQGLAQHRAGDLRIAERFGHDVQRVQQDLKVLRTGMQHLENPAVGE